jgi:hypothetical protein
MLILDFLYRGFLFTVLSLSLSLSLCLCLSVSPFLSLSLSLSLSHSLSLFLLSFLLPSSLPISFCFRANQWLINKSLRQNCDLENQFSSPSPAVLGSLWSLTKFLRKQLKGGRIYLGSWFPGFRGFSSWSPGSMFLVRQSTVVERAQ